MKHTLALLVSLAMLFGAGQSTKAQTNLTSPLPKTCTPGDIVDSYQYGSACVAKDKWVYYTGGTYDLPSSAVLIGSSMTWRPMCSWAFQDVTGGWHCPYETESGRVVGCIPCGGKFIRDNDCLKWHARCLRRVEIMKTHFTVEASANQIPPEQQTDHSKGQQYTYSCPDGYKVDWLGAEKTYWNTPLCTKPKGESQ